MRICCSCGSHMVSSFHSEVEDFSEGVRLITAYNMSECGTCGCIVKVIIPALYINGTRVRWKENQR